MAMSEPADAAYQGARGAFSEDAAREMLGADARLQPCPALSDVVEALVNRVVDAAVVPVENTLAGPVPGAADLLARHPVRIAGEHIHPIVHAVIAAPGTEPANVRRVWSHPVALAQCERWFRAHPQVTAVPAFDTAGAVADVIRRGARDEAAIASRRAAEVYGGTILADAVQDEPGNFTRFLLLKRRETGRAASKTMGGPMKTSLVCVLHNRPGALVQALAPFEKLELNLTRIESRPIPDAPFEYQFHIDIGPSDDNEAVRRAIAELRRRSKSVCVLGTYPVRQTGVSRRPDAQDVSPPHHQ
jgi:prephenate dehydratase